MISFMNIMSLLKNTHSKKYHLLCWKAIYCVVKKIGLHIHNLYQFHWYISIPLILLIYVYNFKYIFLSVSFAFFLDDTNVAMSESPRMKTLHVGLLSHPKPDTRICDHDRHVNIKPKPGINKNQLNYYKTITKASLFLFIFVSLLKWYNFSLDIQSIYTVLKE